MIETIGSSVLLSETDILNKQSTRLNLAHIKLNYEVTQFYNCLVYSGEKMVENDV